MNATSLDPTTEQLWTPRQLIEHIVAAHHDRLRLVLAELDQVSEQIASEHCVPDELSDRLEQTLTPLVDLLETHLSEQEGCLFPMIRHLHEAAGETEWASEFDESVELLMDRSARENQEAIDLVQQVQACLRHPAWFGKSPLVDELIEEVQSLHEDLIEHICLETNVLFPKVRQQLKADGLTHAGLFW
jgi:iron-sulfur cluster repair protein YtfE (RIC family)